MAFENPEAYHRVMRRQLRSLLASAVCLVSLAQCASGTNPAGVVLPEIALAQTLSQIEVFNMAGPISVPYVIQIDNPNSFPIVLDRIRMRTIGAGAYEVRDYVEETQVNIAPGQTVQYRFSVPALAVGGQTAMNLPTNIRVTAYFESEMGEFRKIFTETVGGFAGSVR